MTNSEQVISDRALRLRSLVEGFDSFPDTCDGGDPGTPENPSIWLFGIEPGWSVADEQKDEKEDLAAAQAFQDYTVEMQLGIPFNRNAFSFLAALKGMDPRGYAQFAMSELPFENGSSGYLKGNLFPAACNNSEECITKWNAFPEAGCPKFRDAPPTKKAARNGPPFCFG